MQLRDRTFLLLGGSGGIGRALIDPLVQAGARVLVASRMIPDSALEGGDVIQVQLDLAATDLPQRLAAISRDWPDIDGVIHCAGQNLFTGIEDLPTVALDSMLAVNLRSSLLLARHFVPRFRKQGRGALVFVGSTFGSIGFPGYSAYCATKFGLRGFTEALRRELADSPIQVLYIAPRATRTAMNPDAVNDLNQALGNRMDDPVQVADQILAAMRGDQVRRYLGWPEKFFVCLNGVLPRLVDRAMLKQLPVIRRFLHSGVS
ncbi:SDR family oxidoreductase [Marinobacter nanhaiticus D15-8W]|uniref:SDR family oxidoreductase n=1 Tax=Marinobacter nanhaiticus D15-8W TaxID=626887 RepID=N6WVB5_9GAMM|nr:SDR family oxidoreductase [Marinobacter nanhaiticus]ENO14982.1 SDR family oxidoreductase [Marinobacter nanhaiticus D15-8W]BES69322.1 SDR family oxidoreductase [Marinobacter nanhaiticus D15-8W]